METLKKKFEKCSKLARRFAVFIVNFEHILHLFRVFLLLLWVSKCQLDLFFSHTLQKFIY